MTGNNNNLIPKENYKKVEEVREINNEVPSFEEFMKTYESDEKVNYDDLTFSDIGDKGKGYGPCKKNGCDCSCKWDGCDCQWCIEKWVSESGCERYGFFESSGKGRARWWDDGKFKPSGELEVNSSVSAVAKKNSSEEAKMFGVSGGGSASASKDGVVLKGKLGIDAYDFKDEHKEVRIGLNIDTGGSITNDGIEAKFLGFGISLGEKSGISTPLGEIKSDKCVIQ